ncbi:MAG TPA: hypothetical protein VLY04_25915 [Bryobacteraceae bacterium]|nr:hypothetical protein [Bryobacteraceae bacterium]
MIVVSFGTILAQSQSVDIVISPSSAVVAAGRSQRFTASLAARECDAVWSVKPAGAGTVESGRRVVGETNALAVATYTAPGAIAAPETVTLTAISGCDISKKASVTVTLKPSVAVAVRPLTAELRSYQAQQFTAEVHYCSNQAVTWSYSPKVGTLTASGLYTAPTLVAFEQTVAVTATSRDSATGLSFSATARIRLKP